MTERVPDLMRSFRPRCNIAQHRPGQNGVFAHSRRSSITTRDGTCLAYNPGVPLRFIPLAALGLAAMALSACDRARAQRVPADAPRAECTVDTPVSFPPSPGGIPEATPEYVVSHACGLTIVDVRERDELDDGLGVIPSALHVPLAHVHHYARNWDPDQPIVLVCRSGRRSEQAARQLRDAGFTQAASMTGGMLAWHDHGLPTADRPAEYTDVALATPKRKRLTADDVRRHLADRDSVRWTKAATLLLHGTQACIDGRDAHAIVGTAGGDAGELVAALSTAEALSQSKFTDAEVVSVVDAYLEAFGHFYLHTDEHALDHALSVLHAAHPGVALPQTLAAKRAFLLSPPPRLREDLRQALVDADAIGCGHLRLMLQHADEYGVHTRLVRTVIGTFYTRLWEGHPAPELVVLEGGHAESGVVTVELASDVHAYTKIPQVSPRIGETEVFVAHPQVSAFMRRENAAFLLEQVPLLRAEHVTEAAFMAELDRLARHQLTTTVAYLAPDLQRFVARFEGGQLQVRGPGDDPGPAAPYPEQPTK